MIIAVYILTISIILLVLYIVFIQLQLRNINQQLNKRLNEKTRQPISLELQSKKLNTLAANINKCLKAEETLRLKGLSEEKRFKELIANISHDLRTPLTAIKGYQQLMENSDLTDNQQKKLKIAQKHTDELGELIEYFFEYSYLINSEPELNIEKLNITNLLTECLVAAIPTLEQRNLAVDFKETPIIYAFGDKKLIMRMIQNLIRNCIQHSNGDIEIKLFIKENAVISFKNPVKNSSAIDVHRLFERFYTGDKARKSSGTGLGLSIVKLFAEQMGGDAEAVLQGDKLEILIKLPVSKKSL